MTNRVERKPTEREKILQAVHLKGINSRTDQQQQDEYINSKH